MHEKRSLIQTKLTKELHATEIQISKLGAITDVSSPESTLGDVYDHTNQEEVYQNQLKQAYRKKRRLLYFLDRLTYPEHINMFFCSECGNEIELDRLLVMPKASLCTACANSA